MIPAMMRTNRWEISSSNLIDRLSDCLRWEAASTMRKAALFISQDLLFAGKIQAAAGPLGIELIQESDLAGIERALTDHAVRVVFFDLNAASPALSDVMNLLPAESRPITVAFGPHVNTVRLEQARAAGFDHVLPRSRFAGELPKLLKQAVGDS